MDPETTPTLQNSTYRTLTLILGVITLAAVVIGVGYFVYTRFFDTTKRSIATYEDCVQSAGSELSGGSVCITADGERFTLGNTPDGSQPVTTDNFTPVPVITLIKECPDQWVVEMQVAEASSLRVIPQSETGAAPIYYEQKDEYLVYGGQKRLKTEVDMDWVGQNCDIRPTSVTPN